MMSGPDGVTARDTTPDACPGAVRVHQAADGGLARIRVPGGRLTAAQLTVLATAAADLGDPRLELTSRGNLQIRALPPGAERALAARLHAAGLLPSESHERVRNIIASSLSGRDTAGLLDVRPIVAELDQQIISSSVLSELPGRFLFTLDDGRADVTGLTGDVGLHAVGPDRMALLLAGVDTGIRVPPRGAAALAVAAAAAFLTVREAQASNAWRLAELPDAVARITAALDGAVRVDGALAVHPPRMPEVGVLAQRDGRTALSLVVPLGRLTQAACAALAQYADEIIVTPWRTVIVPDLVSVPPVLPDLVGDAGSPWVGVTSCAGRPHCAKAHADVQQLAQDVVLGGTGLPVHWAGCERRCGKPAGPHVEVLAEADGWFTVSRDSRHERPQNLAAAVSRWRKL